MVEFLAASEYAELFPLESFFPIADFEAKLSDLQPTDLEKFLDCDEGLLNVPSYLPKDKWGEVVEVDNECNQKRKRFYLVDENMYNKRFKNEQDVIVPLTAAVQTVVKTVKKGKHWSKMEERCLIGAIYNHLFHYGSLTTTAWSTIVHQYQTSWDEYCLESGRATHTRSKCALLRHFKVMKQKYSDEMEKGLFKDYYNTWEKKFGHLFQN